MTNGESLVIRELFLLSISQLGDVGRESLVSDAERGEQARAPVCFQAVRSFALVYRLAFEPSPFLALSLCLDAAISVKARSDTHFVKLVAQEGEAPAAL